MASKSGASRLASVGRGVFSALIIIFALISVFVAMAVGTWLGYLAIEKVNNVVGVIVGLVVFFVVAGLGVQVANRLEIDA